MEPHLDKIIGCSTLSPSKLSAHYSTEACAFVSHGFLSVVIPSKKQRFDFKVSNHGCELSSVAFSSTDRVVAVGEQGTNSHLYLFSLSEHFNTILMIAEIKTKENGFSFIALNYTAGRLVTVGNDLKPFLLLWDLTQPRPAVVGYYHLSCVPDSLVISPDANFAVVSGQGLLKAIDISFGAEATLLSGQPILLHTRNFNIGKYKTAHFVASAIAARPPYSVYALTDNGTLCIIDSTSTSFGKHSPSHTLPPVLMTPINLNSGNTTTLAIDRKIILVGTESGHILAIKKDGENYKIFGSFASDGESVAAIGIADRIIASAYDDGKIIFWKRKINSKPLLSLPSHRGPICSMSLASDNTVVLSGGSDGTVREWRIQKNHGLLGKSSQELIYQATVCEKPKDFMTNLTGVKCIASYDKYVFAGDNSGVLHVLSMDGLEELQRVLENKSGIFAIAVHPNEPMLATGGADGAIRLYRISTKSGGTCLSRIQMEYAHNTAVIDITFAGKSVISCSTDGVKFQDMNLHIYGMYQPEEPVLSLHAFPNEKYVAAGGCTHDVCIMKVSNAKMFRKYKLSMSAYPLHIAIDRSGLFIAVAMSDGSCRIVDSMSGDCIENFSSMSGMITQIAFHEDDIIIASISGCIMRWTLPTIIHNVITEKMTKGLPIIDVLGPSEEPVSPQDDMKTACSMLNFSAAAGKFKEVETIPISNGQTVVGEELDQTADEEAGFEAPRPYVVGAEESKVDAFVRASFVKAKKEPIEPETKETHEQEHHHNHKKASIDEIPSASSSMRLSRKHLSSHNKIKAKEDSDPFIVSSHDSSFDSKSSSSKSKTMTKAEEMKNTAAQFGEVVEHVKELLSYKPTTKEEKKAQDELKEMFINLQKEGIKEEWFDELMKIYFSKFMSYVRKN